MTFGASFDLARLDRAKWAFTTRRVARRDVRGLSTAFGTARVGDLVLCEILRVGQHKNIQLADRRVSTAYPGDLVVLALGDRYAPDQFHAAARIAGETAHLVAAGGIVGHVEAAHAAMASPTTVRPLGLLTDGFGRALNVAAYALPARPDHGAVTVIGVVGASMNAGKTTAAASLAFGLGAAGYPTAAIKATGTGAFNDYLAFVDAGVPALDFTDVGMATTYRMPLRRIEEGFATLIGTCAAEGAEVVVCEIADGVFQKETQEILAGSAIRDRFDAILFAAPDALSAVGGVAIMKRHGLAPFAISGMVSLSPLATEEAARETGLPILTREKLWNPDVIRALVGPTIGARAVKTAA